MKRAIHYSAVATAMTLLLAFGASVTSAITLEVARKCDALLAEAFPPRIPGNPAAGSAKGSGRDQQVYYRKCVANGGRPPSDDAKPQK